MDHSELGMGCGIVCGIPVDDIVHLFELLAREEEAQGKCSDKVCGMKAVLLGLAVSIDEVEFKYNIQRKSL